MPGPASEAAGTPLPDEPPLPLIPEALPLDVPEEPLPPVPPPLDDPEVPVEAPDMLPEAPVPAPLELPLPPLFELLEEQPIQAVSPTLEIARIEPPSTTRVLFIEDLTA